MLACACFAALALALPARAAETRILFVGNNFVSANDLPGMFAAVAKSLGGAAHAEMIAPGGFSWQQHSQDKATSGKISSGKWDFVVLQEQSQRPDWPERQLASEVLPYGRQLDKLIRSAGARTVLYETWGHKKGDKNNCEHFPRTCTYEGMQGSITATYERLARETGATLAPVGAAWRQIRRNHPEIELYSGDGIHPSREGTYLAACVIYCAIFGKPVIRADNQGIAAARAEIIRQAAQEAVFGGG
ncbi:MAG: DUF4886 domain-containing protein [Elusimicrobiales bacterium]